MGWSDPSFLPPVVGADWVRCERPVNLQAWAPEDVYAHFRAHLDAPAVARPAVLTVRAFKDAQVRIDGRIVLAPRGAFENWRGPRTVELGAALTPGPHVITIDVKNFGAPAAVAASAPAFGLATGSDWEAACGNGPWLRAALASQPKFSPLSDRFPSAGEAFVSRLPMFASVFAAVFLWSRAARLGRGSRPPHVTVQHLRWGLWAAWLLLAANNIFKFPLGLGHDALEHLDYIRFVAEHWRLPLANEGWQMFQSPLYYLVSAPFYLLFSRGFGLDGAGCEKALRFLPWLCGAAQIELVWRAVRLVFPRRDDLQAFGLIIGGLLPFNLYICQAIGNEPLAGLLGGAALTAFLAMVCSKDMEAFSPVKAGMLLGLALLTKVSAIVLLLPLTLAAAATGRRRSGLRRGAAVLAAAAAVAGWYYAWNWAKLGRPFIGGWDATRGIAWWQDPGYRTARDFLAFGASLRRPIYAGLNGFWDALYSTFWLDGNLSSATRFESRPPWNYGLMISGAWLALVPAAAMALGSAAAARHPRRLPAATLSAACLVSYLAAMLGLWWSVPIYSTAKASYLAALTPGLAVLAAAGFESAALGPSARDAVRGALACWAAAAYFAVWIR